jgi:RNA polymerase sigma factor (TIGR02999 family)
MPDPGEITVLLQRAEAGDVAAGARMFALVYDQLHGLAAAKMARESAAQTLQPTALVHEAWLRLGGDAQPAWRNRAHFFGAAAEAMRRILVEAARRRQAARHGGGLERVEVESPLAAVAAPVEPEHVIAVHEALERFAAHDARKAELVKLHYFAGFTLEEAAEILGVSGITAKRDWAYARAWLFREIKA